MLNEVQWTQYSIRPKRFAICNMCFPGPTRVLIANGISIASKFSAELTRWQTDRPRYIVVHNRRHLRSKGKERKIGKSIYVASFIYYVYVKALTHGPQGHGWPQTTVNLLNLYILRCLMRLRNWWSQKIQMWCTCWMCSSQPTDDKLSLIGTWSGHVTH